MNKPEVISTAFDLLIGKLVQIKIFYMKLDKVKTIHKSVLCSI